MMKIYFIFGFFCGALSLSVNSSRADNLPTATPSSTSINDNSTTIQKNPPRVGVSGVQTQPAGPGVDAGSLDPSQQSSMGAGIKIPLGKKSKDEDAEESDTKDSE